MPKLHATILGLGAIFLWSLAALLTVGSSPVPPFQLTAMCLSIGGVIGLIWITISGEVGTLRRVRPRVYLFGTLCLFSFHFLYFSALRLAPAEEATLIVYLWPLLIVLFSGYVSGESLKRGHIIGGALGFVGAALVVANGGLDFNSSASAGYGLAFLASLAWAAYSLMSRYFGDTPTSSVVVFCVASAILSFFAHLALEDTVWSIGLLAWISIVCLGIGPIGLAFYIWDVGMKHGDIQFLGVASYAAPLISTFALIAVAIAPFTWSLLAASILIAVSAGIAARASFSDGLYHELQETHVHQLPIDGGFVRVADLPT